MQIYPVPDPGNRVTHNRLMNEAVIRFQVPLSYVCPDCYLPGRMCHHLHERDLDGYFTRRKAGNR